MYQNQKEGLRELSELSAINKQPESETRSMVEIVSCALLPEANLDNNSPARIMQTMKTAYSPGLGCLMTCHGQLCTHPVLFFDVKCAPWIDMSPNFRDPLTFPNRYGVNQPRSAFSCSPKSRCNDRPRLCLLRQSASGEM